MIVGRRCAMGIDDKKRGENGRGRREKRKRRENGRWKIERHEKGRRVEEQKSRSNEMERSKQSNGVPAQAITKHNPETGFTR